MRASSGTIGTIYLPSSLSRTRVDRILTNAIVVEISLSPVAVNIFSKAESGGVLSGLPFRLRCGTKPPNSWRLSIMYLISGESDAGL